MGDWKQWQTLCSWVPKLLHNDYSHEMKRHLLLKEEKLCMTKLDSVLKSRDITLLTKICIVKVMIFPSSHVWIWELDHKEGWVLKNGCFWMVLENTLESSLDNKEIKPFNLKGNQPWIFIGSTYDEAEAPILRHLMRKANSLEKTLMLGKSEDRRRRGQQRMR